MRDALKIIAAEDNADDVFLLKEAFKKAGVTSFLTTVCDGIEALSYLNGEGGFSDRAAFPFPDILLLDLNMPRMNGFELLERIKQNPQYRKLVVHVLSTSSRDADIKRAYELHANSFIIKPTRINELVGLVTALHQWHHFTVFATPGFRQ